MTRLNDLYTQSIRPDLIKEAGYANLLQVPKLEKIVINMGIGEAVQDSKKVAAAVSELALITGQKPITTKAKKSVAGFKLREGMPIGCSVTLRKDRMWEFLDRFYNFAIPRIRDFRGLSTNSFDGRGNYSLGIREQIIFPEINYDKIDQVRGLDVTIVTSAKSDEEALELLHALGMPFVMPEAA